MKEVQYIELIFENCDSITLPIDDIEYFYASNINFSMNIHANNTLDTYKSVDHLTISIKKDAWNKQTDFTEMLTEPEEIEYHKLKNRLDSNDITQIHFLDKEQKRVESLYVVWADEDEWHNKYQNQKIIDDKYIVISINKE